MPPCEPSAGECVHLLYLPPAGALLAGKATHARTSSLDVNASKQHTEQLAAKDTSSHQMLFLCLDSPSDTQTTGFLITRHCVLFLCSHQTHYKCVSGSPVAIEILEKNFTLHQCCNSRCCSYVCHVTDLILLIY
jgi:hypothetical protein